MKVNVTVRLPKPLAESLKKQADKRGWSRSMVLEAAYREWLARRNTGKKGD